MTQSSKDLTHAIARAVWAFALCVCGIALLGWFMAVSRSAARQAFESEYANLNVLSSIEATCLRLELAVAKRELDPTTAVLKESLEVISSDLQLLPSRDSLFAEIRQVYDASAIPQILRAVDNNPDVSKLKSALVELRRAVAKAKSEKSTSTATAVAQNREEEARNNLIFSVASALVTLLFGYPIAKRAKMAVAQAAASQRELNTAFEDLQRSERGLTAKLGEIEDQKEMLVARQNELQDALDHAENQKAMHDHASRRFQSLFKGLPVGAMTFDESGTVMEWNPMMSIFFGIEVHQAILNSVIGVLRGEGREDEISGYVQSVATEGREIAFDWTFVVNGFERTVSMVWFPLNDPNGNPVGGIGCALDVTEQRENQVKLASVSRTQRAVLDSADYAIISCSPDGSVTAFNRAAERMLGYSYEEAVNGLNIVEFHSEVELELRSAEIEEECGDFVAGIDALCYKAIRGQTDDGEWLLTRKDGTEFFIRLSITALIDDAEELQGFVLIGKDITDERQIQERLRMLSMVAQEAKNSVVICDAASKILYANPAFEYLTGWNPEEAVGHIPFELFFGEDTDSQGREALKQAILKRRAVSCDLLQYHRDGSTHWVRSSLTPIIDDAGTCKNFVWIQEDVTERKNAEERIAQANERTVQILESIRDSFYSIDSNGSITYANRSASSILNVSSEDLVGKNIWTVCKSIDWVPLKEPVTNAIASGNPQVMEAFFTELATYFEFRIYPSRDGASIFFQNITERKNFQNRLQDQMVQLEEAKCQLEMSERELKEANKRLLGLASTDGLTGLPNHMTFQAFLQEAMDEARELQTPVAVAMMDVDKFKMYNDNFGHQAGDEVLRGVAEVLRETIRGPHLAARYGGEEFVIVMKGLDEVEALSLVEECRWEIEGRDWPNREVTASFGVSFWNPEITDRQALLEMADMALYVSKNGGRNRVTASNWLSQESQEEPEHAA